MIFRFPPKIHVLKNIKHQNLMLGVRNSDSTFVVGLLYDHDAIYLTRVLTENSVGSLEGFKPDRPTGDFDTDTSVLLLQDKVKLVLTKEESSQFHWMIESIDTMELLSYPRKRYIGLVLPTKKISETQDVVSYDSMVIEPILDPKAFRIDI